MRQFRCVSLTSLAIAAAVGLGACSAVVVGEAGDSRAPDDSATATTSIESSEPTTAVATPSPAGSTTLPPVTAPSTSSANDSTVPDVAMLSSTEEVECGSDTDRLDVEPTCYEVEVPEDWENPAPDDLVTLRVLVFPATDEATAVDDPLIYLDGGPGGNTLDTLVYSQDLLIEPYVGERDVIMFDQRGVGQSEPNLGCEESTELSLQDAQGEIPAEEEVDRWLEAYASCNERLAEDGVNFAAYNSVASAHDVEAIRIGLGYDQLNLLGISYGTRLGQTIMRLYPSSLRAVVLDSVVPVAADLHELVQVSAERSLKLVFEACAANTACAERYPSFEEDYFALLEQLDAEPAEVQVTDLDGSSYTFVIDGDDLVNMTFSALYDPTTFASLPELVDSARDGDYGPLGTLASLELINSHFTTEGQHFSVECNEEVVFESPADLAANQPSEPPYNRLQALDEPLNYFDVCAGWNAGSAPAVENEPVNSDIPTLVMTGTFDPITPPSYARDVADHLSNSYLIEFPNEGHGVAPTECGADIVVAFLDDPNSAPDASCVDGMSPPVWVVGGGDGAGDIEMVPFEVSKPIAFSGVRPEGWDEQGQGTYARQQTLNDPTVIAVQATAGIGPEFLLPTIEDVMDVELDELQPTDVDGSQWSTHGGDDGTATYRLLFDPDNSFVIIFAATNEEFDALFDAVVIPVAASLKTG